MTIVRYLVGCAYLAALLALLGVAAVALRSRLVPGWHGAPSRLAEIVLGVSVLELVAELLGTVGWFAPAPLFAGCALVAAVSCALPSRPSTREHTTATTAPAGAFGCHHRPVTAAALGITGIAVAQWMAWTLRSLRIGVTEFDSLQYHLMFAVRFLQDGSLTELINVGADPVQTYYPSGSELVYAVTMMGFRSELLVPVVTLACLGLGLLSGWCAGMTRGVAPLTLLCVAAAFSLPGVVVLQAGTAHNDGFSAAFVAATLTLLLMADGRGALVLAGLAGGLAIGSKLTALGPVLLLTLLVLSLRDHRYQKGARGRLADAGVWLGGLAVTSWFWFLRNAFRTGSPLPTTDLGVGPFRFPQPAMPLLKAAGFSIAHYFNDLHALRDVIVSGWRAGLGPGAWLVAALAGAGVVCGLVRRDAHLRALTVVTLLSTAAYLLTPASAFGLEGQPILNFVAWNTRYALPAIVFVLTTLALSVATAPMWSRMTVTVALALVVVLSQASSGFLSAWPRSSAYSALGVALVALTAVVVAGGVWLARRNGDRPLAAATVGLLAIAVAMGWPLQRSYSDRRLTADVPLPVFVAAEWSKTVTGARIGDVGLSQQFSLTGTRLANRVRYLVERQPHGGAGPLMTCAALRSAINAGSYDFVVVGDVDPDQVIGGADNDRALVAHEWVANDPHASVVKDEGDVTIVRISGLLDPRGCP